MNIIPRVPSGCSQTTGLTLREAARHFADQDGQPLADTTLRDLLKRAGVCTVIERRQSERGIRPMVVIPASALPILAAALSPDVREGRAEAIRAVESPLAPLERGESEQFARIADLERQLAAGTAIESAAAPAAAVKRGKKGNKRRNAALKQIATRSVFVARLACCAILWLYLPEQIAAALAPPVHLPAPTPKPQVRAGRYLPRLARAA